MRKARPPSGPGIRPSGLDVDDRELLSRLADQSRAFLKSIRGECRRCVLTRTQPPGPGPDLYFKDAAQAKAKADEIDSIGFTSADGREVVLDPFWVARYGRFNKLMVGADPQLWRADPLTDDEALRIAREDRSLMATDDFKKLIGERLERYALAYEPTELETLRSFFVRLGTETAPRSAGQPAELDASEVRAAYEGQLRAFKKVKEQYLRSGTVPPTNMLPVIEDPRPGRRRQLMHIEHPTWPTHAAWLLLSSLLQEKIPTLQRLIKPSRGRSTAKATAHRQK